jgi:hypothetical protein
MKVSRQSQVQATVGETTRSEGFPQAETIRCAGLLPAASPPQIACLAAESANQETPNLPVSAPQGLSPSTDAGRPDESWVNDWRESTPARQENGCGENQEGKRPNMLGRPWPLERVPSSSPHQFECRVNRILESAWGVAVTRKPKALSQECADLSGIDGPIAPPLLRSATVRLGAEDRQSSWNGSSETAVQGRVKLDTEMLRKTTVDDPENRKCLGSSLHREVATADQKEHQLEASGLRTNQVT